MAQKAKNIDEAVSNAIDDLLKDFRGAMREAVEFAVDQAEEDFKKEANNCLKQYYSRDPDVYDRTKTLHYAFVPYRPKIKYTKDKAYGSVGIEYDPNELEKYAVDTLRTKTRKDGSGDYILHVGYYGSAKHQPIDSWWVIDNFLAGRHPDGGDEPSSYDVYPAKTPDQQMNEYRDNYGKKFDNNILVSLLKQVSDKMK